LEENIKGLSELLLNKAIIIYKQRRCLFELKGKENPDFLDSTELDHSYPAANFSFMKSKELGQASWCMPIIPATWEVSPTWAKRL
jgi:hypothetical protein